MQGDASQHKSSFFRFLWIFGHFWTSQMDPKSMQKRVKVDFKTEAEKHTRSDAIFYDFPSIWISFRNQNRWGIGPRAWSSRKTKNLTKHCVGKQISRFGLPQNDEKSLEKRIRRRLRKRKATKREKNDFRSSRGSFWEPKMLDFRKFCEILRSLFRDAMEIASKSAEVGGAWTFATVSLVFQRIRSALSVSLSLCLSVDLSLVALILNASF